MSYIFVIDTDQYSGNFERELGAFCTGLVGDCGVGEENAALFHRDCPAMIVAMDELVMSPVQDEDDDTFKPHRIWQTPGFLNDGMGSEFPESAWETLEVIENYRKEITDYQKQHPGSLPEIDAETALPGRYPAYMSVAFYLRERPTDDVLQFLMNRARAYKPLRKFDASFNITGFRLLEEPEVERKLVWQSS